jgi:putative drug exporter of the RND superfamily
MPLARLLVRLRWLVVAGWAAAAAAASLWLPSLQDAGSVSLSGLVPEDAESVTTAQRSLELFPYPVVAHSVVVQRDPDGLGAGAQTRVAARALAARENRRDLLAAALPISNIFGVVPGSREEGTSALTYLLFEPGTAIGEETAAAHRYAAQVDRPDDALVGVTGVVPARLQEWEEIQGALPWVTLASVLVVFAILAFNYRSLLAPLVTLASAGIAYLVSVRVAAWVGEATGVEVPSDVEPVMVVLLLGIVTDYAVFFLSGMRRRLLAGEPRVQAAAGATAQFLPIVATAGLVVAAGAASLLAGRLEFFRAFGPGTALTVLVSLLVAITLVPALMGILGRAVFWPSFPKAEQAERPARVRPTATWSRSLAEFTASRPVAILVVLLALGALALASRGLLETNLGLTTVQGLPADAEEKRAAEEAAEGFAPGTLAPTVLLVEGGEASLDEGALTRLERRLEQEDGVAGVVGPGDRLAREIPGLVLSEEVSAARYLVVLADDPHGARAIDTLERLRDALPDLLAEARLSGTRAGLTGETALAAETIRTLTGDLLRIALAAFLVNFALLALFLRALVAPLYLLLASGLAFAATLGLTTWVFQELLGHGELTYYVPFAVAVLLLSLGSDYNVFLVGRIWQEADRGHLRVRDAIAAAAPRASRTIAVAGVALALSFAMLALVPLRQFREFAFAMCVGVLLDAFVIRALLVPALVSVFGELSWWPSRRRRAEPRTV